MAFHDGISGIEETVSSFLLVGQSNMAGRGHLNEVPPIENPNCYMLRMGRWQPMSEPINMDRSLFGNGARSGIGLSASFADRYARTYGRKTGLIPCADGGTTAEQWLPGGVLFDHAVFQARLAMRSSHLQAILWHQGESDCTTDADFDAYPEKFLCILRALRRELGEDLPIVIGEISAQVDPQIWKTADRAPRFNQRLPKLAKELGNCAVASSAGLSLQDGIHFTAAAYRTFGIRYFEALQTLLSHGADD